MVFINEIMHMLFKEEEEQILEASEMIHINTEFDKQDHYGDNESISSIPITRSFIELIEKNSMDKSMQINEWLNTSIPSFDTVFD
ncbi:unnamed protein product [Adineta steineri]|uniref:Uncharacterized protein n=1 Tax=Adineta steineri TaxID=433720 RepID=A0A819SJ32_9BILA|nr:unnamed protein product [Adineta steineri]CAF4060436.1 unnamed protein product [Adineta steineri]